MKQILTFIFFLCLYLSTAMAAQELVINSENTFNPSHENRFSFLLGVNPSATAASDVTNFTFSYGKKMEEFSFDSTFMITNGVFNKMTTNNATATGMTADQLFGTKSTLTTFGVGIGRESKYSQELLPFDDLYEFMAADLTYNLYKESTSNKSFSGPGMIAKFSLFKKFSEYFSMGPQFIYNLAVVKRSQEVDTETSSARSLTLSYVTIGFDLTFFL